jgi:putative RNA 2'-phosphotransferase
MNRHAVHLSQDIDTARKVGSRHGKPVILVVDAAAMHAAGHGFQVTGNGVWLVEFVPPEFLLRLPTPAAPSAT